MRYSSVKNHANIDVSCSEIFHNIRKEWIEQVIWKTKHPIYGLLSLKIPILEGYDLTFLWMKISSILIWLITLTLRPNSAWILWASLSNNYVLKHWSTNYDPPGRISDRVIVYSGCTTRSLKFQMPPLLLIPRWRTLVVKASAEEPFILYVKIMTRSD